MYSRSTDLKTLNNLEIWSRFTGELYGTHISLKDSTNNEVSISITRKILYVFPNINKWTDEPKLMSTVIKYAFANNLELNNRTKKIIENYNL